jgi:hypothetical protein
MQRMIEINRPKIVDGYYRNEFHGMIHDWYYWSKHTLNKESMIRNEFRYMWE